MFSSLRDIKEKQTRVDKRLDAIQGITIYTIKYRSLFGIFQEQRERERELSERTSLLPIALGVLFHQSVGRDPLEVHLDVLLSPRATSVLRTAFGGAQYI